MRTQGFVLPRHIIVSFLNKSQIFIGLCLCPFFGECVCQKSCSSYYGLLTLQTTLASVYGLTRRVVRVVVCLHCRQHYFCVWDNQKSGACCGLFTLQITLASVYMFTRRVVRVAVLLHCRHNHYQFVKFRKLFVVQFVADTTYIYDYVFRS